MSILNTFDRSGKEIIKAENNIQKIENFPKTIIVAFSIKTCNLFVKKFNATEIGCLTAGQRFPIYRFEHNGIQYGFFNSSIGGSAASALLEELIAMGAEKFLYFGSCGALDNTIAEGHLLIPTEAYRDEGVSYHYAEPSDFIKIESAQRLIEVFEEIQIPYNTTKTWTTDAFYRETDNNLNLRKNDGCSVVEMECASIMAVGQFRHKEVYQFLYAADCLDDSSWNKRVLGNMPNNLREKIIVVAAEIAYRL